MIETDDAVLPGHEMITVTLLDTETGKTAKHSSFGAWSWVDGNGNCDCNRELAFDDLDIEWSDRCSGNHRFLVIDASGPLAGYTVADMNDGYALELCKKYPASMQGADDYNMKQWERLANG